MSKGFAKTKTTRHHTRTFIAELKFEDGFIDNITGVVPVVVPRLRNAEAERILAISKASKYLSDTCNHIFLSDGEGVIAAHIHDQEFVEGGERARLL